MNKYLALLVLSVTSVAAFSGCNKDNGPVSYSMRATINGVAFTGTSISVQQNNSVLNITGGSAPGANGSGTYPSIELYIANYAGKGTYSLVSSANNGAYIDSGGLFSAAISVYGTVIITCASPDIVGTFSFTALDSTKVTKGSFTSKQP